MCMASIKMMMRVLRLCEFMIGIFCFYIYSVPVAAEDL